MKSFNIAILGFGTVGSGVYKLLNDNRADYLHRDSLDINVVHILVKDFVHEPNLDLADRSLFTTDYQEILNDSNVDIVVECMGGVNPARSFILSALEKGKTVVTSNKEVVSKYWYEFDEAAKESGAGLYIEATVGGGIPIIRTIIDSLQANNISKVMGIINGTTNYILTQMSENGVAFSEALKSAQELGYAEANPTADVEGFDATYKLSILSSLAFHAHMPVNVIYREGIVNLTEEDFAVAKKLGYEIKLLAIAKKKDREIEVRVHPTMIPYNHPLASVRGVFNAVFIHGHAVDDIMLYGRGAGSLPTASAVVSDVIYACHMDKRHKHNSFINNAEMISDITLMDNFESKYCIRVKVHDKPGTMASIADCFARNSVSLKDVLQLSMPEGDSSHITFMTHVAHEFDVRRALEEIGELPCVEQVESIIRAES